MKSIILTLLIFTLFAISCLAQDNNPLFVVIVNDKRGYIDRTGNVVIEPQFQGAGDFSEGLASVAISDSGYKEGYIDKTGKIVIEPKWDTAGKFSEGLAWVGFDQAKREYKIGNKTFYSSPSHSFDYKFGLIDKTGKYIVEPTFTYTGDFSEGLAVVRTKEDKFGFIDKTGKFIIETKFNWAGSFSEGLACVYVNGKYGFINKNGEVIIKPTFTDAGNFSEGLAYVKLGGRVREHSFGMQSITTTRRDRNFAYIDKTGRILFKVKADNAFSFSEGLARISIQGNDGYIDKMGRIIIQPVQGGQSDFSEGLSFAILGKGEIGYIDKTGKVVLKPEFALAEDFKNGLASVRDSLDIMKAKYGYIDKKGKVIWKPTR
jgi:hypothetical protein